ncbi:hypothetical protein JTE90_008333 [Oedothorax gibbosus]|uniref:Uncharacterized protein n=1 Tax=Oedothorax gibbosus TaxID=931172 RepID=A0AAV6U1Q4_9ARAC|nr:hypothetical protein JTE90_008333 [Oedothorax gibbosus]
MPNLCLVLPEKDSSQLRGVKKMFQGSILLYDNVIEEDVVQIKAEENDNFVKPKYKNNGQDMEPKTTQFESEESEAGPSRKSHKKKKSKVKVEPSSDME